MFCCCKIMMWHALNSEMWKLPSWSSFCCGTGPNSLRFFCVSRRKFLFGSFWTIQKTMYGIAVLVIKLYFNVILVSLLYRMLQNMQLEYESLFFEINLVVRDWINSSNLMGLNKNCNIFGVCVQNCKLYFLWLSFL